MVSLVNPHTHATRFGWHLWETDLRFAPGLPPGWGTMFKKAVVKTSQNPLGGKETKKLRGDIRKRLDISEAQLDTFFGVLSCPTAEFLRRFQQGWQRCGRGTCTRSLEAGTVRV